MDGNAFWWKQALDWIGFICILLGVILLVKHFTVDMRLGDADGGFLGRRTYRAAFYALILAIGIAVQRLAAHL